MPLIPFKRAIQAFFGIMQRFRIVAGEIYPRYGWRLIKLCCLVYSQNSI